MFIDSKTEAGTSTAPTNQLVASFRVSPRASPTMLCQTHHLSSTHDASLQPASKSLSIPRCRRLLPPSANEASGCLSVNTSCSCPQPRFLRVWQATERQERNGLEPHHQQGRSQNFPAKIYLQRKNKSSRSRTGC